MSQSYLIFSEGRKMEINAESRGNITASYNGNLEVIEEGRAEKIKSLVSRWESGEFQELRFCTTDSNALFDEIKLTYNRVIIAAGGLVCNPKGELLVIFCNDKWDLPKGKIEEGEKIAEGAVREVMEETGLASIKIENEFMRTYHSYMLKGKIVLKETVWFLMSSDDNITKPQLEEGITMVEWIAADKVEKIAANTFDNILLLLKTFFREKS